MRLKIGITLVSVAVLSAFFLKNKIGFLNPKVESSKPSVSQQNLFQGMSYVAVDPSKFEISMLASNLVAPTRIRITPDGKYLLVSQLTGEVLAFPRTENGWSNTSNQVVKIETHFAGYPPDQAGLTGFVLSNHFDQDGKIFLLYTFKDSDKKVKNRISITTVKDTNGKLVGSRPHMIFDANMEGSPSHQITDGLALDIAGKTHILFLIGEGFEGKRAQDIPLEAGKLVLIQEDGSNPIGLRPYPQNPKIQAIGIRNAYVITQNPYDKDNKIMIADTGPDHYDRLIYTNPFNPKPLNFGWAGNEDDLKNPIPDPNFANVNDMVILRLFETKTFTGFVFHPGGGSIPNSNEQGQSVLVTLFGKTESAENQPGKEIWLGRLTNLGGQPKITFTTIIKRASAANGKLGNPVGLEVDAKTGDFFFADILEGKIYKVKVK